VIIGTAGHIDHGKTALVKALTGIDADRLKEEQQRGITIDLGFAHLDLPDLQLGFVDVPGHEKFVKNMLAGVGGIDCVLLVVAGDESIMPQSREHFEICRLLGISAGIVVITKIDTVDPELVELVREEVKDLVRDSFLEGADIIPVSSKTGQGVGALKEALENLALSLPERHSNRPLRLPVDRCFSMRGFGTVVTGTLNSGQLKKEDEVELVPGGLTARVRSVQVHGLQREKAVAGQRTAVNLQGVDLSEVHRGMVLTSPNLYDATQLLDVRLDLLESAKRLKNFVKVRFHLGTSEVLARIALLGQDALDPGETGYAQLRLDSPVLGLMDDPFIIRQFSPVVTIGGGVILNPKPTKHKTTDAGSLATLQALEKQDYLGRVVALLESRSNQVMTIKELSSVSPKSESELLSICNELHEHGRIRQIPSLSPILVSAPVVKSLEEKSLSMIEAFHRRAPLLKGIPREELREQLFRRFPLEVFRFCLNELVELRKIALEGDVICNYGREVKLPPDAVQLKDDIEQVFQKSGYQPPLLSDLLTKLDADPPEARKIYFWMVEEGLLVKITEELSYHRVTLDEIKQKILGHFSRGDKFGVAEFKKLFGLTRKYAIPLLEFLDREKITRRQGNERILC
jgi:selenocysteine-specific elongation factor